MAKNFIWGPDGVLPRIEEHTKRKLDVLKNYLDVYFDTVVRNPAQDRLNITLVDGEHWGCSAHVGLRKHSKFEGQMRNDQSCRPG